MFHSPVILALDLLGTFAFALNGALTAARASRLDLVGVLVLGMVTALGGGMIRDILLNVPPATFGDLRYLGLAAGGALVAFVLSVELERYTRLINVFDAIGLSVFCVTGMSKALEAGMGSVQAVILGVITAVGGGTLRDVAVMRVPTVLTSDFYAVPALVGAALAATAVGLGLHGLVAALVPAAVAFTIRMLGIRYSFRVPQVREGRARSDHDRPRKRRRGRKRRDTDTDTDT
ncbi:trimeric intracellular cation channel family protein [Saccharomonospora azurea]|uniref:Membrane protein n=3 Tax=Saccharomonospora azurea TaxID=40988 RepID=H8GC65_9PSEU|nr:trimeric intracellular cation channel family protein [Saccharomonospora azurea]EHY87742.1 putative membrane protein [Saccharomonospora azurea NA-128]